MSLSRSPCACRAGVRRRLPASTACLSRHRVARTATCACGAHGGPATASSSSCPCVPDSNRRPTTPRPWRCFGPLVLAADLGPAQAPFDGPEPALVGEELLASVVAIDPAQAKFRTRGLGRPADLELAPFFSLHDRRTAVYFK